MMKPTPMGGDALNYFMNLAGQDAFHGNEPTWTGTFSEGLQLDGKVTKEDFKAAFEGFTPTGEKITRNAGVKGRDPGWELMFAPSKSVSIAWAIGSEEMKANIVAAHQYAVAEAMKFTEANAVIRFGKGGKVREQAYLQAAVFQHFTSRETVEKKPDPQLHSHVLVFNNAISKESGRMGALHSYSIYENRKAIENVYEAALASRLQKIGFGIQEGRFGWELRGVSFDAIQEFSQRNTQIDKHTGNSEDPEVRRRAVLSTRQDKKDYDKHTLELDWKSRAKQYGLSSEYIDSLAGKQLRSSVTLDTRAYGQEQKAQRRGLTLSQ